MSHRKNPLHTLVSGASRSSSRAPIFPVPGSGFTWRLMREPFLRTSVRSVPPRWAAFMTSRYISFMLGWSIPGWAGSPTLTMRSPGSIPAWAAGLPGCTPTAVQAGPLTPATGRRIATVRRAVRASAMFAVTPASVIAACQRQGIALYASGILLHGSSGHVTWAARGTAFRDHDMSASMMRSSSISLIRPFSLMWVSLWRRTVSHCSLREAGPVHGQHPGGAVDLLPRTPDGVDRRQVSRLQFSSLGVERRRFAGEPDERPARVPGEDPPAHADLEAADPGSLDPGQGQVPKFVDNEG